jgi:hypothetical protein
MKARIGKGSQCLVTVVIKTIMGAKVTRVVMVNSGKIT